MARRKKRAAREAPEDHVGEFRVLPAPSRPTRAQALATERFTGEPAEPGGIADPHLRDIVRALIEEERGEPFPRLGAGFADSPPDMPNAGGWGHPIVARMHNAGTAKKPKWVYLSLPVGLAVGIVAAWEAERLAVDAWNAFPGSYFFGKARPVADLLTWGASWIVPSGASFQALSAQVQSAGTGAPPPTPQPAGLAGGSALPAWLQGLLGAAASVSQTAGATTINANPGTTFWQDASGAVWPASTIAQAGAYALLGYTSLGTSVTLYRWYDGSFHTTAQPAGPGSLPYGGGPGPIGPHS